MANLGGFRTAASAKIGLNNTNGSDEQNLIDTWTNEGVIDVLMRLRPYVISASVALTANQGDYTLDSGILTMTDVQIVANSSFASLQRISVPELLELRQGTVLSDVPGFYALDGTNLLMVWPTPTAAYSLTIYYIPRPTAMSSAAHDPSTTTYGGIPSEYHKAIEYFVLWQAGEYANHTASRNGTQFRDQYEIELRKAKKNAWLKGGRPLGPAKVGGYRAATNRNDVYP